MSSRALSVRLSGAVLALLLSATACGGDDGASVRTLDDGGSASGSASGTASGTATGTASAVEEATP